MNYSFDHSRLIARALEQWFAMEARSLPWRKQRSGYSALVAEAMLQQTQVARVTEPFQRFMEAFPDVHALARATEDEVLAAWQGLGYYRRARSLHAAARLIVERFGGRIPTTADELLELPGVGRYTAGAISSMVYHQREPIVDGNVQRVLMRLDGRRTSPDSSATKSWTWRAAGKLVESSAKPGVLNEALMELGATVCTPRSPRCAMCPVCTWCRARRRGLQDRIPRAKARATRLHTHHHAIAVNFSRRFLLVKRSVRGMWAGMWQVPTIESDLELKPVQIRRLLQVGVGPIDLLGGFEHHTTHRRITFHVYRARAVRRIEGTWRRLDDVDDLALSAAQRRVLRMLREAG